MSGHRDPRTLSNLPEILSCLSALQSEEAELSNSLAKLLNARDPIIMSVDRLHSLVSHLHEPRLDASLLLSNVSQTAETAERIGGQVRSLDDEMGRVREAGERVGQVMELKVTHQDDVQDSCLILLQASLASLQSSIENQDWESATRHCARAMSQSMEVTSGRFAETAVVSIYSMHIMYQVTHILLAYLGKSFTPHSDIANCPGNSPIHLSPEIRGSLQIP